MTELPRLRPRDAVSHKGSFGHGLLVGGSRGMTGAIALAGMAALRSGAGLVTLAVPESCLQTAAAYEPSYMTVPLPEHDDRPGQICAPARQEIEAFAGKATCIGYGPGIGRSEGLDLLVAWLYEHMPIPVVIDADGLNGLSQRPEGLANPGGPRILTPHPGEFRRLVCDADLPPDQWQSKAEELARENNIVLVLKGHHTLITDGHRSASNNTGNPGMATGGTGDVLTGVITALVCQGLPAFEAAQLGVHVHGLAGDLAAGELGHVGMIARDLLKFLPPAFLEIARVQ